MTPLLAPKEVAAILGVTTMTLETWRGIGTGPAWVKLGEKKNSPVRYARDALQNFIKERTTK